MTSPPDPFVAELWTKIQALYAPLIAGAQTATTAAETATTKAGEAAGSVVAANAARADAQAARDEIVVNASPLQDWVGGTNTFDSARVSKPAYYRRRLIAPATNIVFADGTPGRIYTIVIEVNQDSVGGRKLTFQNVTWGWEGPIDLSTAPNAVDIVSLLWTGSRWIAGVVHQGVPG